MLRLTIRIGYLHSLEVKSDLANIFLTFGDLPLTTACIRVCGRVARVPVVLNMTLNSLTVARLYSTVQYSKVQYSTDTAQAPDICEVPADSFPAAVRAQHTTHSKSWQEYFFYNIETELF